MRSIRCHWLTLAIALTGVFALLAALRPLLPTAAAQEEGQPDIESSVYLNDSFEAADAVRAAERLAESGQWHDAALALRQVNREHADKLIETGDGIFVSTPRHVARVIATWPPAGLRAYRQLVDAEFRERLALFENHHDIPGILQALEQFYCASDAADVIDRVVELALEGERFPLAEHVLQRALAEHPDRESHEETWRAYLAVCRALAGRNVDPKELPDVALTWRGTDTPLPDILDDIRRNVMAGPATKTEGSRPSSDWTIFGGNLERSRRPETQVHELGLLWKVETGTSGQAGEGRFNDEAGGDTYTPIALEPVVKGDVVVVQRMREVIGVNLNTGAEIWRFNADGNVGSAIDEADDFLPGWHAPTIHGSHVYAAMPNDTAPYYGYEATRSLAELVCLDLQTGRPVWRTSKLPVEDSFSELSFDSSPIVAHDRVYLVGRRRRSFGFEDCYLHAFDAADGRLEFRTHLGSASSGSFGSQRATVSIPGMHGDVLYVGTNLGTIAAVSASTGSVIWLRMYERAGESSTRNASWSSGRSSPWEFNPAIYDNGRLIFLPADGQFLDLIDASDGALISRFPLAEFNDMRTVIGVRGNVVCGTGNEVTCLDLESGAMRWSSPVPRNEPIVGRGAWVDDMLLVPTRKALERISVVDGSLESVEWPADGAGGSIIALPDRLIVAGAQTLSLYVQKHEIWAAVRARMASAPNDPVPAIELAEVAFGSGEIEDALDALDEAVRRADLADAPLQESVADRIFADAFSFARRLSSRREATLERMDHLATFVSLAAANARDHARYRLAFAEYYRDLGAFPQAIDLLQQILADVSLRATAIEETDPAAPRAGPRARAMVAAIIAAQGRDVYADVERRAATLLQAALDLSAPAPLTEIAEAYPNSDAAAMALLAQARLYSAQGRPADAVGSLTRAYHRYGKDLDRADLIWKIAGACKDAGYDTHAYRWLEKGAAEFPTVRFEHAGRRLSFVQRRDAMVDTAARLDPGRPSLKLPLGRGLLRDIDQSANLLTPRFSGGPLADHHRFFVRSDEGLEAFTVPENRAAWPDTVKLKGAASLVASLKYVAVFATRSEMIGVAPDGQVIWQVGESAPDDDPVDDWESRPTVRPLAMHVDRLVYAYDDSLRCIDVISGREVWRNRGVDLPHRTIRMDDRWLAFDSSSGGETTVHLLNAATGDQQQAIRTIHAWTVEDLTVTVDDRLYVVSTRLISAYDARTGSLLWVTDLKGQVERHSIIFEVDGVVLCDDARRLRKLSYDDGSEIWTSGRVVKRVQQDIRAQEVGDSIIISTTGSVVALDAIARLELWNADLPPDPQLRFRAVTDDYFLAVHMPQEDDDSRPVAIFIDHRHGSGEIPSAGGRMELSRVRDIRHLLLLDNTLLVQTGNVLLGWTRDGG